MKKLIAVAVLSFAVGAFAEDIEDYTVTTAGTMTFESPVAYGKLENAVSSGVVIFDQSAYEKTEAYANSFTNFDAVADSSTTFLGGWWDFGLGAFLPADRSGRTVTLEGGAVVTNVGAVTLAGATGMNNKLRITDESAMSADSVTLGAKDGEQHNDLEVVGGSSLTLSGNLKMSAYPSQVGNNGNNRTRNVVTVAGEGTTLNVAGSTYLSWVSSGYYASTGGNSLYVTNGATASLGNLYLTQGLYYGGDDIAYFADDAHITTKSISMANSWSSASGRKGTTRLTVASGATVTNTGAFALGTVTSNSRTSPDTMELVVSNGTFHTDALQKSSTVSFLLAGPRATIRLSGPDAKATFRYTGSFALFARTDNQFIIENGAKFAWPWGSFCYTDYSTKRESVIVRGAGTKMTFGEVSNTSAGEKSEVITTLTNRFVIADGAVAEGRIMKIGGGGGELSVSNATLSVSDNKNTRLSAEPVGAGGNVTALAVGMRLQYGGMATNCVVSLSGTCPHLVCTNGASAEFRGATRLVFNLPAEGYDADVVPFEVGNLLTMTANCEIRLNGVQDMLARHRELDKEGAKYVLVKAKTLSVPESILEATRASLPENVKLTVRNAKDGNKELVLQVGKRGLVMIVR